MNIIIYTLIVALAIGFALGVLLGLFKKIFYVKVDPKIQEVRDVLYTDAINTAIISKYGKRESDATSSSRYLPIAIP